MSSDIKNILESIDFDLYVQECSLSSNSQEKSSEFLRMKKDLKSCVKCCKTSMAVSFFCAFFFLCFFFRELFF